MNVHIVGIDCATVDAKVGLSLSEYQRGSGSVKEATLCSRERSAAGTVIDWLRALHGPILIAIDAPLGWPEALARALSPHQAGEAIETPPNSMFRRNADQFIKQTLVKRPLGVGADRIARTAHAALQLLGDIRKSLGPIPLAWSSIFTGLAVIEVYPAATLVAHGFRASGYKGPDDIDQRREVIASLRSLLDLGASVPAIEANADVLDAVVCALAAIDFLGERAMPPIDPVLAARAREGWIWAARSIQSRSSL